MKALKKEILYEYTDISKIDQEIDSQRSNGWKKTYMDLTIPSNPYLSKRVLIKYENKT